MQFLGVTLVVKELLSHRLGEPTSTFSTTCWPELWGGRHEVEETGRLTALPFRPWRNRTGKGGGVVVTRKPSGVHANAGSAGAAHDPAMSY